MPACLPEKRARPGREKDGARAGKGHPLRHVFLNAPAATYRMLSVPLVFMFLQTPRGARKHVLSSLALHCVSVLTPVLFWHDQLGDVQRSMGIVAEA